MKRRNKKRMTLEEKRKTVEKLSGADLIAAYKTYHAKFNPLDEDCCESFEVIKTEIVNRLLKAPHD